MVIDRLKGKLGHFVVTVGADGIQPPVEATSRILPLLSPCTLLHYFQRSRPQRLAGGCGHGAAMTVALVVTVAATAAAQPPAVMAPTKTGRYGHF